PAPPALRRRRAARCRFRPAPRRRPPPGPRLGCGGGCPRRHRPWARRPAGRRARASQWRSSPLSSGPAASALGALACGGSVEREAAPGAGHRIVNVLAQDDPAVLQLHLEHRALGQAQRIAHRLGEGDLAALGDGGFHGRLQTAGAAIIHTLSCILPTPYPFRPRPFRASVTEAERETRTLAPTP